MPNIIINIYHITWSSSDRYHCNHWQDIIITIRQIPSSAGYHDHHMSDKNHNSSDIMVIVCQIQWSISARYYPHLMPDTHGLHKPDIMVFIGQISWSLYPLCHGHHMPHTIHNPPDIMVKICQTQISDIMVIFYQILWLSFARYQDYHLSDTMMIICPIP